MKTNILTGLFCAIAVSLSAQTFSFTCREIGEFSDRMGQTSLVDIDNDGDLDWVFGRFGTMSWFENRLPKSWQLHALGEGAKTDVGGCPHDVNADGWVDYIVGDSWYENPQNPREETFILHKKNMIRAHDNVMVDIDADGILDVVALSNHKDHPVLCWYRIPEDHRGNWDYHKIGPGIHGGTAPHGYGDLDGDGDVDLVRGNAWFENIEGKGRKWKMHETLIPEGGNRPDKFGLALRTWCYDLDGDGDLDVIQAEADTKDGRVFWFENHASASDFEFHLLSANSTKQDFHSLALADFDLDGDLDICSGGGPLSQEVHRLYIWENRMNQSLDWKAHLILEGKRVHELVAADVDGDGDIDICAKPWRGGLHIYIENKAIK